MKFWNHRQIVALLFSLTLAIMAELEMIRNGQRLQLKATI
jgi:hypothetical protein